MNGTGRPKVITVYHYKGGVAKSTLASLLGAFLAGVGYRVAIVDFDSQGSQSEIWSLIDDQGLSGEVLHLVLKRRVDVMAALTPIPADRLPRFTGCTPGALFVLQGGEQTQEAVDAIAREPARYKIASSLSILSLAVEDMSGLIDFVIVDTGPSNQVLTMAVLAATNELLIPTTTDYGSVVRITPVLENVEVARQANPSLNILGVVSVMTHHYFGRLRKSKSVQKGENYLNTVFEHYLLRDAKGAPVDIPYDEAWPGAAWTGEILLAADASSRAKADALRFLNAAARELKLSEVAYG